MTPKQEGKKAYVKGLDQFNFNPYYPGSVKSGEFKEGWDEAEWEQTMQSDCPWRSRVICTVGKKVCLLENCGLWYFKNNVMEGRK